MSSVSNGVSELFPCPLTAFDAYMVADDKQDYPSSNCLYFVFRGTINVALLQQSFEQTIEWEPSFLMRLRQRRSKLYWDYNTDSRPTLDVEYSPEDLCDPESGTLTFQRFDCRRDPLIKTRVVVGKDSVGVHIDCHHCAADGLGILEFLGSWLIRYALLLDPTSKREIYTPDLSLFSCRGKYVTAPDTRTAWQRIRAVYSNVVGWLSAKPFELKNLPGSPPTLSYTSIPPEDQIELPILDWRVINVSQTQRYCSCAKRLGVTVNTLFMRDLFLTLKKWGEAFPQSELKGKCFRVLMPRNLRTDVHLNMPCTDMVGYTFLDFSPSVCDDVPDLMRRITEKTHNNHNTTLFLKAIAWFAKVPGLLSVFTKRRCACTAVLSNVGRISDGFPQKPFFQNPSISVPDLELIRYIGAPLVRPGTPVSIGVTSHAKEMVLSFAIDRMHFNETSSRAFVSLFMEQFNRTIGE